MFNALSKERNKNINIVIEVYLPHKKGLIFDEIFDKFKHNIIV